MVARRLQRSGYTNNCFSGMLKAVFTTASMINRFSWTIAFVVWNSVSGAVGFGELLNSASVAGAKKRFTVSTILTLLIAKTD